MAAISRHIRQTSPVSEYVERFTELVDQLIAYGHSTDPMYYTIRFIDGLRDEIRSTVPVQRPPTLDTACSLAKLQEEVADPVRRRDSRRPDAGLQWKHPPPCIPLQLPAPPRIDKPPSTAAAVADDNRGPVAGRPDVDKFSALKSYRRARVLYDKCAERWRPDHQCAPTVHLHMVQELMDLLTPNFDDSDGVTDGGLQMVLRVILWSTISYLSLCQRMLLPIQMAPR